MRIEELDGAAANWRPWEPPTWLVAFGLVFTLAFGVAHAEQAGGRMGGTHEGAPTQPGWVPPPHELPCTGPRNERKAEVRRVERHGRLDVLDHVPDVDHPQVPTRSAAGGRAGRSRRKTSLARSRPRAVSRTPRPDQRSRRVPSSERSAVTTRAASDGPKRVR